ncbi:MAG: site-specific integrase [Bacteroidota bacterium]
MRQKFSLLFYLRNNRMDSNGMIPIFMRVTVDGKRSEVSTGKKIKRSSWNPQAGRARGYGQEAQEINGHLQQMESGICKIQQQYTEEGRIYTAKILSNSLLGKGEEPKLLLEIYRVHNNDLKNKVGSGYSHSAYMKHIRTCLHLGTFLAKEYGVKDIRVGLIDLMFVKRFERHLNDQKIGQQNTITKYVTNFKKIIRIAHAHGWIEHDPFYHWKAVWIPVQREALSESELKSLSEAHMDTQRLEEVRDVFLFCCFTGLAHSDVERLSENDMTIDIKGEKWIRINRKKTKVRCDIPLLGLAEEIILKYKDRSTRKGDTGLLPVISNQKTNLHLKEIAKRSGIKKNLTHHLVRHTFATTITLSNGVPIESVSRMLGHRSLKTTQIYAKVVDRKLREDMDGLQERLDGKSFMGWTNPRQGSI